MLRLGLVLPLQSQALHPFGLGLYLVRPGPKSIRVAAGSPRRLLAMQLVLMDGSTSSQGCVCDRGQAAAVRSRTAVGVFETSCRSRHAELWS